MSGELLFGPRYRRTYTHHASHSQFLHHRHFRNHIHLWAGMVRDILGSLILKFPQEPAVYFHVSPGRSKKTGWVQKKTRTWWRPVLSSPGLLTCLHQAEEDEEECLPALHSLYVWKLQFSNTCSSLVACSSHLLLGFRVVLLRVLRFPPNLFFIYLEKFKNENFK